MRQSDRDQRAREPARRDRRAAGSAGRRVHRARSAGARLRCRGDGGAHLKLLIAKLRREQYGQSSERGRKLLDQLELPLEEVAASAAEDEAATAQSEGTAVGPFTRRKPVRAPFPVCLPRGRVAIPGASACPCCGGKPSKLGETITGTLEVVPRQGKVIQTVCERFACRSCEKITRPPAPFHVIPRGHVGPSLLAMILDAKHGEDRPLNRQSEAYAREGVNLDVSTLADHVGAGAAVLSPLTELIRRHVFAAERVHGDETTVPVLARGKTITGRLWTYLRDDRPFAGPDPPAAVFFLLAQSRRRASCPAPGRLCRHPAGRRLCRVRRALRRQTQTGPDHRGGLLEPWPAPLLRAGRSAQSAAGGRGGPAYRRDLRHRAQDQWPAGRRLAVRQRDSKPVVADLEKWMRARLSRHAATAQAIDYRLTRWPAFTRFLDDGRICLGNNAAERALRGIAPGRRSWRFAGSDSRRRTSGGDVHADRHDQAQRHRPASLARRRARPHRRSSRLPALRASPLALEKAPRSSRCCCLMPNMPRSSADATLQTGSAGLS